MKREISDFNDFKHQPYVTCIIIASRLLLAAG